MSCLFILIALVLNAQHGLSDAPAGYVTQTVYGFLDFTTTIQNTVMVFSPQSAPALDLKAKIELPVNTIKTKPVSSGDPVNGIKPTKSTQTQKPFGAETAAKSKKEASSSVIVISSDTQTAIAEEATTPKPSHHSKDSKEMALQIENNIQPEYDLLSRQPTEYAEETYRVVNLKSRIRNHDHHRARNTATRSAADNRPVGLVTKLSGSESKNGVTTFYETSVIGTYISGKYAQVLQSSSDVFKNERPRIQPTSSLRVLKTVAPLPVKPNIIQKVGTSQSTVSSRKRIKSPAVAESSKSVVVDKSTTESATERVSSKKTSTRSKTKRRNKHSRTSAKKPNHHTTTTTTTTTSAPEANNRRSFRPKIQASSVEPESSSSLYSFKLNRTPGRWQYKTSPKPRISIRKPLNDTTQSLPSTSSSVNESAAQNSIPYQGDLEPSGSQNGAILNNVDQENNRKMFVETLNVEISTPPNGQDTYYEIATIKTPYIFQAGVLKKTRYITVTSTFEKVFQPEPTVTIPDGEPLTENILETSSNTADSSILDSSIVTLNPIYLTNNAETPILETITESFSITHTKLKTHLLPIVRESENNTSYLTLVQTYDYTSLITVTKTLSPLDDNQFVPSLNFKDFGGSLDEAGSEINLELEFGDEDNLEVLHSDKQQHDASHAHASAALDKSKHTPTSPPKANLNPEQIQQLALLNLFNPTAQLSTIITTTRPVIKLETVWESHVVPLVNGQSTVFRTLSKSIGTVSKTEYQLDTTTVQLPPVAQPLPQTVNPYLLPVQQFQTITSPIVLQTIATQTNSKILKLTFGAKTAYTTIYSTQVMPTALTTFITTSLPVQATAPFPGYFPQPYPPFGYLG